MKKLTETPWLRGAGMVLAGAALLVGATGLHQPPALAESAAKPTQMTTKTPAAAIDPITQATETLRQSNKRWLEVNLTTQRLIAWEGNKPTYAVIVSTGKASTPTRLGVFKVQSKHRLARMQGNDYDVPDVPFTMYYSGGYAIHGAYWHNRFGTPVSHGCINVAVNHAEWVFNWATIGTPVVVRN